MDKKRLQELAGIQLNEGAEPSAWNKLYDEKFNKFMAGLEKEMNATFKGKTVVINFLDSKDRHTWKDKEITVTKVTWEPNDSNGPVFHTEKGEGYHSHPDHKIRLVK